MALSSQQAQPLPSKDAEETAAPQVGNVCFIEGLVTFQGRWLLYYGTADSRVAVATGPAIR